MAAIYSQLLLTIPLGSLDIEVTVPDGVIWIIRDILCLLTASGDRGILEDVTTSTLLFYQIAPAIVLPQHTWQGRQVCPAGTLLFGSVDGSADDMRVSGYVLSAP